MHAHLTAIEYYLPEQILSTADLAAEFPEWEVDKIDSKTGIHSRHIVAPGECTSDLAVKAAEKLFASGVAKPQDIDFVLLCTETPDFFLPATACLVQDRLGIPATAGVLDFNLGSSGYVYGLGLAEGLIATGQASRVLLLTGDTYSKLLYPSDRSVRTIFGDAAAATLLTAGEDAQLGPFIYGTDGSGWNNLIVPAGGLRQPRSAETAIAVEDDNGNTRSADNLFMDGGEIFNFTIQTVPPSVQRMLQVSGLALDDIDLFVFHQANQYMLEHLRKRCKIPAEKFQICFGHCGNTVSCTIPIALHHAIADGKIRKGSRVMLVGFGVGYSWGAAILRW
jgi:3-oxoacyl-[acyl-carrier-protein] synthase-3